MSGRKPGFGGEEGLTVQNDFNISSAVMYLVTKTPIS
jgi:hypothetical protein